MIYHDIDESNYFFTFDKLTFYFSSMFYKEKFLKTHKEFLKEESIKLKTRYKCTVDFDYMILLLLYKNIEKRGFRVYYYNKRLIPNYYIESNFDKYSFEG